MRLAAKDPAAEQTDIWMMTMTWKNYVYPRNEPTIEAAASTLPTTLTPGFHGAAHS